MLIKAAPKPGSVGGECEVLKGRREAQEERPDLTYGKLCQKAAEIEVPRSALKNEDEFRYMGKPTARLDIPEKVAAQPFLVLT